ncbi:MAG: gliding motility-associated C-terminal domain-containing protein [Flavobacteriales bacterium]|nr:gliding motility-associated C-terminal domain-containing protein [Flavobacteriales bacterium]
MKNKLTSEELKLQSKLNEADFAYQESHWTEMEQILSKKSIWTKYGSIFKAALVFISIVGSVVLLQEFYPKEEEQVSNTETKEAIQPQNETIEIEPSSPSNTTKLNGINVIKKAAINQEEVPKEASSQVEVKQKIKQLNSKELELAQTPIEEKSELSETLTEEAQDNILDIQTDVLFVELESAPCLNEELRIKAVLKEALTNKDVYFKWFINESRIEGNGIQNSLTITSPGKKHIIVRAYYKDKLLSEGKNDFTVENKLDLNFVATDLDGPFYDHNVNLKVDQPSTGTYRWYIDKREQVQFGKETAWSFIQEGRYSMTLEHVSPNGCINKTSKLIEMEIDFIEAFPNAFSPDNNGVNEVFVLTTLQGYNFKSFKLEIVTPKGELVFQTNDPTEGWNGRLQNSGNLLPNAADSWGAHCTIDGYTAAR